MMGDESVDDLRGSAPVMSTKELLLEVYHDMKFVRPAVDSLLNAGLVKRVEALEDDKRDRDAASRERGRIGSLTNKGLAVVVLVVNFVVGLVVVAVNLLSHP